MTTIVTRAGKGSALTHNELDTNFTNLNTDKVEASGDSMTGDLSFGDNNKAVFGAGSDLQIYHDGATNRVVGSIDVTGTVTTDGLNVAVANGAYASLVGGGGGVAEGAYHAVQDRSSFGYLNGKVHIGDISTAGISSNKNLEINLAGAKRVSVLQNGNVSFYEDTGTTALFHWDASGERLGIGNSNPQSSLHITDFDAIIKLESSSSARIQFTESDVADKDFHIVLNNGSFLFNEVTSAGTFVSTPFLIEGGSQQNSIYVASSGNVGMRTSNPLAPLHINNNDGVYIGSTTNYHLTLKASKTPAVDVGGSTITALISTSGVGSGSGHVGIEIPSNDPNDGFYIATDSDQDGAVDKLAMKINAAGNVGINFNDPQATLDVHGSMRHITGPLSVGAVNGIKWNFTCSNTGTDYDDVWLLAGTVNIATGNYKAASIHYVMQYPENNFGNTTRVEEYRGVIKITRTASTTQDDPANAEIYGPDMSPVEIRVYKVSVDVYEIQVKNTQPNRYFSFDFMQTSGSGAIDVPLPDQSIVYYANQATLTGGTAYTRQRSSALGLRQIIDAKNIHSSEGIYLGGTGAANLLDDYEEGTWTPTITGLTSGSITGFTVNAGNYTKIGNVVHAYCFLTGIDMTSSTVLGSFRIGNLPITGSSNRQTVVVSYCNMFSFLEEDVNISGYLAATNIILRKGSSILAVDHADVGTNTSASIMVGITYHIT